ncbi:MAG: UDP-3-O-(3-hydroxymyristoyl)glucosamine N-acyltransferase [Verrucomicrobiaceae bacterium]|nr:UDP-3-O-(3-hydroxymyristoyl)glucosamine N-acyltransferase [Verrucomicrobiaceae bacterium]
MNVTVQDLLEIVDGKLLSGDAKVVIEGFANLREAVKGDLSFFHDPRYETLLVTTKACAVLVPQTWTKFPEGVACVAVADPSRMFETIVEKFGVQPEAFKPGVHATAVIGEEVKYDPSKVHISAHAVIEDGVEIADGVEIGAGCFVGRNARIGAGSKLFANVSVHTGCLLGERVVLHSGVVIGGDGFGYEFDKGRHRKVRQAGIVQIDNDVEIGAGTMVDRARFGRTWIGEGTKIDNLVQIGHNVVIGKHCIIVAATAIAGSAHIGDYVVIAAQCGVAGHVKIGSQATLAARCGVTKDLAGGMTYMGYPAVPAGEEKRRLAGINRLPHLSARVKKLEKDQGGED